jgi:type IV pilus assembly PilN-like protein
MISTLKPLDLDFRRTRPPSPWAGWVLLAVAALFVLDLGYSYYAARASLADTETRLGRQTRATGGPARAAASRRTATPEEIALARETVQRLSIPRDDLFGALESAATDRVSLTAIEPDVKAGTVVISGEGKDFAAVLDYVARLQRSQALQRPHLVKHEFRPNDPNRPVAFAVSAFWGGVKP